MQCVFSQQRGYGWSDALATGHKWPRCWECMHEFPVAPFTHALTLIPAWISYHMLSNVWDGITYTFLNIVMQTITAITFLHFLPKLSVNLKLLSAKFFIKNHTEKNNNCEREFFSHWSSLGYMALCNQLLTHWGRVTHIYVGNLTIIGSDNGLSPGRRQAIIWTNAGILLIGPLGINFIDILIEINTVSFNKMHLKMSSAKWRLFRLGLNVLSSTFKIMIR